MTRVILSAGQSNALGFGMSAATLPASLASFDWSATYISVNGSHWGQMQPGVNTGTPNQPYAWGPEVAFAAALRTSIGPGEPILILKSVKGETFLDSEPGFDWSPSSSGELFDATSGYIASRLTGMGHPLPSLLLWTQGEQDGTRADTAAAYSLNLDLFLDAAFDQWLADGARAFIAQLPTTSAVPYAAAIRDAQQANVVPGEVYLAAADHMPMQADSIHYAATAHVGLGNTFASMWDAV
jgi:hypothetical protein